MSREDQIRRGLKEALANWLEQHGSDPAFHVKPRGSEDEDLAQSVASMMPTLNQLFLHPEQAESSELPRFRPWMEHLIEAMVNSVTGRLKVPDG